MIETKLLALDIPENNRDIFAFYDDMSGGRKLHIVDDMAVCPWDKSIFGWADLQDMGLIFWDYIKEN